MAMIGQLLGKSRQIGHGEFEFDFVGHEIIRQKNNGTEIYGIKKVKGWF